uniref:Thioredoxin domain-containing protein n=1 Tax=Panagrellus redivivus TaxID=6233 RepID=A0A7E4V244_PANRE
MKLINFGEAKQLIHPHHIANILLSLSFLLVKCTPYVCDFLFSEENCALDGREHEILIFLGVIIVFKNRKATNWLHYLSTVYMFSKAANCFLFFRIDTLLGIAFSIVCLLVTVLLPEPVYLESNNVTYFRAEGLWNEINQDKRVNWIIVFFTSWSPECRHVTPVFSKLSDRFTLPNLRFGKLDVGRYPKEAERFRINVHPTSRQLPTISLFRDGEQAIRRPVIGPNKRAIPFVFNEENCIQHYDLLNLYEECKNAKFSSRKNKNE